MFRTIFRIWAMYRTLRFLMAMVPLAGFGGAMYAGFPEVRSAFAHVLPTTVATPNSVPTADITVGFSPGKAEAMVLDHIASAKSTLDMEAYEFTNKTIAEAVRSAQRRGVKVRVIADQARISGKYNAAVFLANNQVSVRASSPRYKIFHNKVLIVDGEAVQTGSFNYTSAAVKSNAENVLILRSKSVADTYTREFERLWAESRPVPPAY